jgi:hypothetical protein
VKNSRKALLKLPFGLFRKAKGIDGSTKIDHCGRLQTKPLSNLINVTAMGCVQ